MLYKDHSVYPVSHTLSIKSNVIVISSRFSCTLETDNLSECGRQSGIFKIIAVNETQLSRVTKYVTFILSKGIYSFILLILILIFKCLETNLEGLNIIEF